MRNSDLMARIGAGFELLAIVFNLVTALMWFLTLIWVLIGLLWGFAGLVLLGQLALVIFVLVKGYTPVGIASPVIGLVVSLMNFNVITAGIESVVLVLMIVSLVVRGQEDAALTA